MKCSLIVLLTVLLASVAWAAPANPPAVVTVQGPSAPARAGERVEVSFQVDLLPEWHIYAPASKGGLPFSVTPDAPNPFPAEGGLAGPPPLKHVDEGFGYEVETYEDQVVLKQGFKVPAGTKPGTYTLKGTYQGQTCDPSMCMDIAQTPWEVSVPVEAGAARAPAPPQAPPSTDARQALAAGPFNFFLVAMAWGFATLLTPCVYPMVPVTIAYFSKQGKRGSAAVRLAGVYALGIVVLFTVLGILASLLMKGGVVSFGNNPYVNLFVGLVFVVFALSLFGAFELTLPSGLMARLSGGRREGVLGALFLGFVFAVTSFACTAPFAGSVLAIGVQSGRWVWPVVGVAGFSTALAIPFFFLAMFPGLLRSLPRSGGWMESVKHVCAFVELGAALKFLGAADVFLLEGDFLTRSVVVALWAALSVAAGLYLLGCFRFHGEESHGVGTVGVLAGTAFLALGLFFTAGLASGERLGPWEAFLTVPGGDAASTPTGRGAKASELPWIHGDLDAAMAAARQAGKRIFADFSAPT